MRKLSAFQRKPWMDRIGKLRKYKNQAKGSKHPKARLNETVVRLIRSDLPQLRKYYCNYFDISERHWYHIRAGQRWIHL